jgi:hypothetical protein
LQFFAYRRGQFELRRDAGIWFRVESYFRSYIFYLWYLNIYCPFTTNINSHNLESRQRNNLYTPQANLSIFQKGAYCFGKKFSINYPLILRLFLVT